MARWSIDTPTRLDFDGIVTLRTTLVTGHISILPTDGRPSLEVAEIVGHPLSVTHDAGVLTITHEAGGLDGVLKWLQSSTRGRAVLTLTVPRDCPVQLNLGAADAVVCGLSAKVSVKSFSGGVTLDGVTGAIDANTASGDIEAQGLTGTIRFNSVSGDLTLVGGRIERLTAHSVSGAVTADVELTDGARTEVDTVSGAVRVRLPDTTAAEVSLTSATGSVNAAFVGLRQRERMIGKTIVGTVGDGTGSVRLNTVSGGITLLSRPHAPEVAPASPDREGEQ
jgi:hypothetical protein